MGKRVFLIVLDSYGIGEMPDAYRWNDEGSNTLGSIRGHENFNCPNMTSLGLFNIDGIEGGIDNPKGSFARLTEMSNGKDTTTGHWEMAGIISEKPFPVYPEGFPKEILDELEEKTGKKILCNKPYSGTDVIRDYGKESIVSKGIIVYTSADSVMQIAAHEEVIPVDELYKICEIARGILTGEHAVGRVIARPFDGEWPYKRTSRRHDFSLEPGKTMLDVLKENNFSVISVGKIFDIFAGKGLTESNRTSCNDEGMDKAIEFAKSDFDGLCFVNLVDFDMEYGHRNDVAGYAKASTEFDVKLGELIPLLKDEDILMVTADHGCDPGTPSTDHSREYVPLLIYGKNIKEGVNLGTRSTFADISASILEYFGLEKVCSTSESFMESVLK